MIEPNNATHKVEYVHEQTGQTVIAWYNEYNVAEITKEAMETLLAIAGFKAKKEGV